MRPDLVLLVTSTSLAMWFLPGILAAFMWPRLSGAPLRWWGKLLFVFLIGPAFWAIVRRTYWLATGHELGTGM